MKGTLIVIYAAGLLIFAGCSLGAEPIPPTNTPRPTKTPKPPDTPVPAVVEIGDAEKGQLIFENGGSVDGADQHRCSRCHTVDGSDEKNRNGPGLQGISEFGGERVPGLSAAQYIHQSILDPRAYVVDGYPFMSLTARNFLTEAEVADLVAFLLTQ